MQMNTYLNGLIWPVHYYVSQCYAEALTHTAEMVCWDPCGH